MKVVTALIGAAIGGWRRGIPGVVLGGFAGWGVGCLLATNVPAGSGMAEDHYHRYPEEGMIDALVQAAGESESEAAEFEALYRSVCAARGFVADELPISLQPGLGALA